MSNKTYESVSAIINFIEDRKTPWSEIQSIEVDGDFIKYTEKYDVSHPACPIVRMEISDNKIISFSEIKKIPKLTFELMFGSIESKD